MSEFSSEARDRDAGPWILLPGPLSLQAHRRSRRQSPGPTRDSAPPRMRGYQRRSSWLVSRKLCIVCSSARTDRNRTEDSNFNHGARYMMRWERVTTVSDKASCVNFLGDRTIFWGDGMVFYENPPCAKLRIITSRDSLWCSSGFAT